MDGYSWEETIVELRCRWIAAGTGELAPIFNSALAAHRASFPAVERETAS